MFLAYKFGLIKVTAKFRRIMTMMIIGYAIFAVVNFIFAHRHQLHLRDRRQRAGSASASRCSPSAWPRSPWRSTSTRSSTPSASGAPQKYSWLLAHGLIVTLVWLYIEFLRLFARLRS